MNQDAGAEVRVPRSALGSVQRALLAVHTAVGLRPTLRAIAEGVARSTPFQEVAVTVAEVPDSADLRTIAVVGSAEVRAKLLETTCRREALLAHLAAGEPRGALRFRTGFENTEGVVTHRSSYQPLDAPDAWRPDYELDAPLYDTEGELVGMLSMDRPRDGRIPPVWVNEILELFAEQAVIAILNAWRHEQAEGAMRSLERERAELRAAYEAQCARESDLHWQSRSDPLTGLANRLLLRERIEALLTVGAAFALVFCDLDRFKQINDTYGHAVGDAVLRVAGQRLANRLADADVVARIGGDEFVVVVAGVREREAAALLRRIGEAFAAEPLAVGGLSLRVTSSLGLVCEPGRTHTPTSPAERVEELLRRADREMYAHKRSRAGVDRLFTMAEAEGR